MPGLARLDAPGILHHIIIRGIERQYIFRKNTDQMTFIERLSIILPKTKILCYAWVLANIVSSLPELNNYPYCGHGILMGKRKVKWQDTQYVLGKQSLRQEVFSVIGALESLEKAWQVSQSDCV